MNNASTTDTKSIEFCCDFEKLPEDWENTKAVLVSYVIKPVHEIYDEWGKFAEFDTKIRGTLERSFIINFENAIVLFFIHIPSGKVFATLRKYNIENVEKYGSSIGKKFVLIRTHCLK